MTHAVSVALAILTISAFVAPVIAEKFGLPAAVLEILIGMAFGFAIPSSSAGTGTVLGSLGSIGFVILMFLVGVQIDLHEMWTGSKKIVALGLAFFFVCMAVSYGVFGLLLHAQPLWVLCGAAASVGITAPILYSQGWLNKKFGKEVVLIGAVAELAYILVLNAFIVASSTPIHQAGITVALRTGVIIGSIAVLGVILRMLRTAVPEHFMRWMIHDDPEELGVRGTFAVLFLCVAIGSFVKIPSAMGAMLSGIMFRMAIGSASGIIRSMTTIANSFFVPLFFLVVGLETGLERSLVTDIPMISVLMLVLCVPRLLLVPFLRARGHPLRLSFAGSFLLMAPLTLIVTTTKLGISIGIVSQLDSRALVLAATLSAIVFPVIARQLLPEPEKVVELPVPERSDLTITVL